jgi:hypothetical protein
MILVIFFEFESICGICFAFHLHLHSRQKDFGIYRLILTLRSFNEEECLHGGDSFVNQEIDGDDGTLYVEGCRVVKKWKRGIQLSAHKVHHWATVARNRMMGTARDIVQKLCPPVSPRYCILPPDCHRSNFETQKFFSEEKNITKAPLRKIIK